VRIYGHYALIKDEQTSFYCHLMRKSLISQNKMGKRNGQHTHLQGMSLKFGCQLISRRICSAINQIPPGMSFDILQSKPESSQQSDAESVPEPVSADDNSQHSQSSVIGSKRATPTAFPAERTMRLLKRPRTWP
jgi:hypothetical protein